MKGIFDSKELVAFLGPLNSLARIIENGLVLHVSQTNKNISTYPLNQQLGVMAHVIYNPEIFKKYEFSKDEKIGILNIPQLIKYFQIVEGDTLDVNFEEGVFSLTNQTKSDFVNFRTADCDMIKESPQNFRGHGWYSQISVDSKFKSLQKAISVLDTEECVVVKGEKSTGKITLTVRAASFETNSFKLNVETSVSEDFETFYRKDVFERAISTPSESITVSFGERVARFECKSKYCDITYYLGKKQIK